MACSSTTGDFGLNLLSSAAFTSPQQTTITSPSLSDSDDGARTPSQSDDSYRYQSRKRRRGVIEKRRRDRINNCLSELRRLVPAAFEKQGSQKLEKAEILQFTVEHLKFLQSRGIDTLQYDPHRFATDYHTMGFRECASTVSDYLSRQEGMDLQHPLKKRLMDHLQCYGPQKAQINANSWPPPTYMSPTWSTASPQPYQGYSHIVPNRTYTNSAFSSVNQAQLPQRQPDGQF